MKTTITPATTRICPHFPICGGCSKQDLSYEQQLEAKQARVQDALQSVPVSEFLPILPSPQTTFYRNKMEYSFGDDRDLALLGGAPASLPMVTRVHLGLHPKKRFNLVTPTDQCALLSPESQKILAVIAAWATEFKLPAYVRAKNAGVLRHVVFREGKNTGQRLVNLVSTSALTHLEALAERLKPLGAITTFLWTLHDGLSDVARGDTTHVVWGDGVIYERVGKISAQISPFSFMQTNTHAAERMIEWVRAWMSRGPERGVLFDLYCGTGTIGLNMTDLFERVIGIEVEASSVDNARQNAVGNGCLNVEFIHGRVEELVPLIKSNTLGRPAIALVDPPRIGLHAKLVEALRELKFSELFYVSCNPDTLARDLKMLAESYDVAQVQPMDFFPHTDHVETAVRLIARSR